MELNWFDICLLAIFALILAYLYGMRKYNGFKVKGVKNLQPVPFLGNLGYAMIGREHFFKLTDRAYSSFPDQRYFGFYEFLKPIIWIRDPEIIKMVTTKDFNHFTDHRTTGREYLDPIFTESLFSLTGEKWHDMRTTLSPSFTGSKMRAMFPLIIETAEQSLSYIADEIRKDINNAIDMKDFFTRYANDVIASAAFGINVDSLKDRKNEFYTMGTKITKTDFWLIVKYFAFMICPKLMKFFGLKMMKEEIARFFRDLVKHNMAERETKGINRPDMIQLLMEAKQQYKDKWSDDQIASQAFIFFIAGFETTSTLLTYAAYELATHQDVQDKLRAEIASIGDLTYDKMIDMKYLDGFISETLRLRPPVAGFDRVCVKPYTLPSPNGDADNIKYTINTGDSIFIPTYALHRDAKYFPEPLKFNPDRFAEENRTYDPYAYVPFGIGPRQCIGSRFALMETKILLIRLLSKFTFDRCDKTVDLDTAKMKMTSILPDDGVWINFKLNSVEN